MTKFKIVSLIGAAFLALAACGSGGDPESPTIIVDADEPTTKF